MTQEVLGNRTSWPFSFSQAPGFHIGLHSIRDAEICLQNWFKSLPKIEKKGEWWLFKFISKIMRCLGYQLCTYSNLLINSMQIHTWYTTAQRSATAIYWRDLGKSVGNRPLETPDLGDTLRKSRSWFSFCPDYSIYQLYPISRLTCLFAQWGGDAFFGNIFLVFMFLNFWQSYIIKPVFCIMFALVIFQ